MSLSPSPNPTHPYRGRIAPSPTGYLHLGHARTFWIAAQRTHTAQGVLVFRDDDLDASRVRPEFQLAQIEDLRWLGIQWQEGPDVGGPLGPYQQSLRLPLYRAAFEQLQNSGALYPCSCSRKDILSAITAPNLGDEEPIYPGACRPSPNPASATLPASPPRSPGRPISWRFRVPDGESIDFHDANFGPQTFVAGRDFGDFVVWRPDQLPSYQLACVVDDAAHQITEVVRGADLLLSTARQLLLYRALGLTPPAYYHCSLLCDSSGRRLAKRHDSLSLRALRTAGITPAQLIDHDFASPFPQTPQVPPA